MNDLKGKINILKNDMSNSNEQLNKIIENFELFYDIGNHIINSYNKIYKNFYVVNNINNIIEYNEIIMKDIDKIINETNVENKNNYITKIYEQMIISKEFNIKYKWGKKNIK